MDIKNLTGTFAFLKTQNRLLKFAVVVIAASNVLFGLLAYTAVKTKQVVVVPLTSSKVLVANPDPMYVLQVSRFVFDNLGTYTPWTVKKQYELVLQLFDPSVYHQYKKIFDSFVKTASESKLSSVFIPQRILHCQKKHIVKAEGLKFTFFEDTVVEKKFVIYEIKYRLRYGTLTILSFKRIKEEIK